MGPKTLFLCYHDRVTFLRAPINSPASESTAHRGLRHMSLKSLKPLLRKSLASSDMSWCRDVDLAALKSARHAQQSWWVRGLYGGLFLV